MPTYLYENLATGEHFEVQQRITEPAYSWKDPKTGELGAPFVKGQRGVQPVKRLIAGAPAFNLVAGDSGGWAETGYSKPEHARKAEQALGRKLHKPL